MNQRLPKLLSVNNYHYRRGGADAVFLDHDAQFRGLGWQTAMFCMKHPRNEASPWQEHFVDELEFGSRYSLLQKAAMAAKVVYSREARRKLTGLLDVFSPDIAHLHCIYHHISPSILPLLKERGIPAVMTAHDLKLACPAYKMLNRHGVCERCRNGNLLHVVANRCIHESFALSSLIAVESATHRVLGLYRNNLSMVVVPSRFFGAKLAEWGWPEDKLAYVPNFIDAADYEPDFSPGDYFLYFGRLAPEKGVATLIRAVAKSRTRVLIAGTGPYESQLRALSGELGHPAKFLGYCQGRQLRDLIAGCRAVVLPSEWYENAPISILEAYASGKPVLGADIGGIPEMVSGGETGFLFPSGDEAALADLLSEVGGLGDDALAGLGHAGHELVTLHFTRSVYLDKMLDLYAGLSAACARPFPVNTDNSVSQSTA